MSTVIKAGQAGTIAKRLTMVNLSDHLAEAKQVIREAHRRAEQKIAHAREEADRLKEQARQSGYEAGYQKGLADGTEAGRKAAYEEATKQFQKQHADVVSAMRQALAGVEAQKNDLAIAAQRNLLEFAVLIARRLTFAIGELHHEAVRENFRRALDLVGTKTELSIRLNPADRETLAEWVPSLVHDVEVSQWVRFVEDETVAPGGCEVSTRDTSVDATLETQVDDVVAVLLGKEPRDG